MFVTQYQRRKGGGKIEVEVQREIKENTVTWMEEGIRMREEQRRRGGIEE